MWARAALAALIGIGSTILPIPSGLAVSQVVAELSVSDFLVCFVNKAAAPIQDFVALYDGGGGNCFSGRREGSTKFISGENRKVPIGDCATYVIVRGFDAKVFVEDREPLEEHDVIRIQRWRRAYIFVSQRPRYGQASLRDIVKPCGNDSHPCSIIGFESFPQSAVSNFENDRADSCSYEQQRGPNNKPLSKPHNRIALAEPPPLHWLTLVGTALVCLFLSFVSLPDIQPVFSIRYILGLALYVDRVLLGLSVLPGAATVTIEKPRSS